VSNDPASAVAAEGVIVSLVALTPAAVTEAVVVAVPDLNVMVAAPTAVDEAAATANEALPEAVVADAGEATLVVSPEVAEITAPLITFPAASLATTVIAPDGWDDDT
jgi:hypothetical protein